MAEAKKCRYLFSCKKIDKAIDKYLETKKLGTLIEDCCKDCKRK